MQVSSSSSSSSGSNDILGRGRNSVRGEEGKRKVGFARDDSNLGVKVVSEEHD